MFSACWPIFRSCPYLAGVVCRHGSSRGGAALILEPPCRSALAQDAAEITPKLSVADATTALPASRHMGRCSIFSYCDTEDSLTVAEIRAGQLYGEWATLRRLGGGGNGEVWLAHNATGRHGAIKVLRARGREGRYRLGRFKDEISFLIDHPSFPGILPLLDSHISADLAEPSWYVMPVASTIREVLGSDPAPETVVAAMADIATTLGALAAERVAHRDIKPDNLFVLDGRWVIGDFGLVTYPEKDPRTGHGRKLGPVDYMAPEMRRDADQADPGPADVWALGKTLWVLLTGQLLPLPGTHLPSDMSHSLQERITFGFAAELDLLLEKATQIEPTQRPSMADMARELQACTAPPPEAVPSASLAELHARVAALTATSRQHVTDAKNRVSLVDDAYGQLLEIVSEKANELNDLLTFNIASAESGFRAAELLERPPFTPWGSWSYGYLLVPPGQPRPVIHVIVAAAMTVLREGGPEDIAAVLRVERIIGHQHEAHQVWGSTYCGIPLASAQQANVMADIRTGFTTGFDDTLRLAIQILSGPSPLDPAG